MVKRRDIFDAVLASVPMNGTAARVTSKGDHYDPKIEVQVRVYSEVPTHSDTISRCIPVGPGKEDLTGRVLGRLTVIGFLGRLNPKNEKKALWLVRCVCGNYETRKAAAIKHFDIANNHPDRCLKCLHFQGAKKRLRKLGSRAIEDFT